MKPYKIMLGFKRVATILFFGSVLCVVSLILFSVGFFEEGIFAIIFQLIGAVSLLFFVPLLIYIFLRFITLRPAVIISEKGITDKSQLYGSGFIGWEEIRSMSSGNKHDVSFLTIETHDPDLIKDRAKGPRRWFINATDSLSSAETQLDVSRLAIDGEELIKQIEIYSNGRFNATNIFETNVDLWTI